MPVTVNFDFDRNRRAAKPRELRRVSDGDTPVIELPIRMVSCDTPEKAGYAGKPETAQPKLDACRSRLETGFYDDLPATLRNYLIERLAPDAAERHIGAGDGATRAFEQILDDRLTRPDGKRRKVATIPTGEIVDGHGRLLAYIAPWFTNSAADPLPPRGDPARRTFNLEMIETGWAALFPIYPSLARNSDMNLAIAAAEVAWEEKRGAWGAFGHDLLLAYEFRACIKLGTAESAEKGIERAFQRVCVDLRDLKIKGEFGFPEVPPPYRLWVWEDDLEEAREVLDLVD